MMRIDIFVASRALRSARCGSFAPRFWPTRAVDAMLIPSPGMNTNDWTRSPIWWAATASSPNPTTITIQTRRPIWNANCSSAAGTPIRRMRRIVGQFATGRSQWMPSRTRRSTNSPRKSIAPVKYEIAVPIAAPRTPRAGNPKFPKIRFTLIAKFTTFSIPPMISGVFVSPAARRAEVERKMMNWNGRDVKIIDTKPAERSWMSDVGENGATMAGANTQPITTTGMESSTPATMLWKRTWSAPFGSFAPMDRATRAIVPAVTPIITVWAKNTRFPPIPTAAMSATPRRPTMIRSTVVVRTCRKFAMITGQARSRIARRRRPVSPEK